MASALFSSLRRIAWLAAFLAVAGSAVRAQGFGDGFDPNGDSNVYAMVRQPDGKLVVGGNFTLLEPDHFGTTVSRQRIARINRDGTIDSTFTTYTDGDISALAIQPDGKIVIAGKFTIVGSTAGEAQRTGIARLNADGSVDSSFVQVNPVGVGYYPQAIVRAVAVQADGRILIGGAFTTVQPTGTASPVSRSRIARLNADGTLRPSMSQPTTSCSPSSWSPMAASWSAAVSPRSAPPGPLGLVRPWRACASHASTPMARSTRRSLPRSTTACSPSPVRSTAR